MKAHRRSVGQAAKPKQHSVSQYSHRSIESYQKAKEGQRFDLRVLERKSPALVSVLKQVVRGDGSLTSVTVTAETARTEISNRRDQSALCRP